MRANFRFAVAKNARALRLELVASNANVRDFIAKRDGCRRRDYVRGISQ